MEPENESRHCIRSFATPEHIAIWAIVSAGMHKTNGVCEIYSLFIGVISSVCSSPSISALKAIETP